MSKLKYRMKQKMRKIPIVTETAIFLLDLLKLSKLDIIICPLVHVTKSALDL